MSIPQSSPPSAEAATVPPAPGDECPVEGNWVLYRERCQQLSRRAANIEATTALQRVHAHAYLGKRAQRAGGVFSSTRPSVFTTQLVEQLARENTERRHARYPWLAQLLAIAAELDREQHGQTNLGGTILAFPASRQR